MINCGYSTLIHSADPSLIAVSGCPSGHVQDFRGTCRQIFQYTVNFGGANPNAGSSRFPWLFNKLPTRRHQSTTRDIVKDSALFKQSILRGYVPPFVFSGQVGGNPRPRLQENRDDIPAIQSENNLPLNGNSGNDGQQTLEKSAPTQHSPAPMEVILEPMLMLISDAPNGSFSPTINNIVPLPGRLPHASPVPQPTLIQQRVFPPHAIIRNKVKERKHSWDDIANERGNDKGDKKENDRSNDRGKDKDKNRGGGSSENFDRSRHQSQDNKKKDNKNHSSTTKSSKDDDD